MPTQQQNRARPTDPERALVVQQERLTLITKALEDEADAIGRILPATIDPGRFQELIVREIANEPKLLACHPPSLIRAVVDMARVGLEPVLDEAYLVPFYSSRESRYEATMILGFQGLKTLAFNSGLVVAVDADVVYAGDEWSFSKGSPGRHIHHVKQLDPAKRGARLAAWAEVYIRDAQVPIFDVLPLDRIEQARKVSRAGTNRETGEPIGIWRDWYDRMAVKTALRAVLQLAPRAIRSAVSTALELEERADSLLRDAVVEDVREATGRKARSDRRQRLVDRAMGVESPDEGEVEGDSREVEGDEPAQDALGAAETPLAPPSTGDGEDAAGRPGDGDVAPDSGGAGCGDDNPFGGAPCGLPAGHLKPGAPKVHRELDATGKVIASWPAKG